MPKWRGRELETRALPATAAAAEREPRATIDLQRAAGPAEPAALRERGAHDAARTKEGSMCSTGSLSALNVATLVERAATRVVSSRGHREVAAEEGGSR